MVTVHRHGPSGIEIRLPAQDTPALREELHACANELRDAERLSLCASLPTQPEVDFAWAIDLIRPQRRDSLFIGGARIVTIAAELPLHRLATANWIATFRGVFSELRVLDLRDARADLADDCMFAAVETLILRPRHAAWGVPWATRLLANARAFPSVRELRFTENDGDALLAALLDSPLLPQLRILDVTDNVTNTGAQLMFDRAAELAHLEAIWVGSGRRRATFEQMQRPGAAPPPPGTLEIEDAWRSRLRHRLGKRLRFKPRPNHPDL